MGAHLPVSYIVILVTGKWLGIACKYFVRYKLFSSLNFGKVTDGQTDAMHMSPPNITRGVLTNEWCPVLHTTMIHTVSS